MLDALKVLFERCRLVPDNDDYIQMIVSTSPKMLNHKLAEWVKSVCQDATVFPLLKREDWYIFKGNSQVGYPYLMSGEDLLEFKAVFAEPPPLPKKFTKEMVAEFERNYFASYSTAWQTVMNYHSTITHTTTIYDARTYLLINMEEFLQGLLDKVRLQYELSVTDDGREKTVATIMRISVPLQAIRHELTKRVM